MIIADSVPMNKQSKLYMFNSWFVLMAINRQFLHHLKIM